jgi:hypothetical protein
MEIQGSHFDWPATVGAAIATIGWALKNSKIA